MKFTWNCNSETEQDRKWVKQKMLWWKQGYPESITDFLVTGKLYNICRILLLLQDNPAFIVAFPCVPLFYPVWRTSLPCLIKKVMRQNNRKKVVKLWQDDILSKHSNVQCSVYSVLLYLFDGRKTLKGCNRLINAPCSSKFLPCHN